ncbi:MAG: hypothetical protein K2X27_22110 [Candidatus Obscuribacterales bacterium]|nr:hypothetical protein [Candidatus Obscuribacterales bacterium]
MSLSFENTKLVFFAFLSVLFCDKIPPADAASKDSDFFDVVSANFAVWDLNRDGILSGNEIARALQDPACRGKAAAALAALKTQERLDMRKDNRFSDFTLKEFEDLRTAYKLGGKPAVSLVKYYNNGIGKIEKQAPQLFKYGSPHITHIRQGQTSDCYFLAPVASMTEQRSEELVRMIEPNRDDTFTVRLKHFEPIVLAAPTEAEIATYTDAGDDGIWLMLLEKAYATVKASSKNIDMVEELDVTALHGGNSGRVIYYLTGHKSKHFKFSDPLLRDGIRGVIKEAFARHRLVTTGVPGHCLAVLRYDEPSDSVLIWNPWGSTRLYKAVGMKMEHGYFWISLSDFVQRFSGITVENEE